MASVLRNIGTTVKQRPWMRLVYNG